MRWAGFRRVRGQVGKRIARRLRELGLPDASAYRDYLEAHAAEWSRLDALCRITISRFYRDRGVFDFLRDAGLPSLAAACVSRGADELRGWVAGCASGEEAFTLKAVWKLGPAARFPALRLALVGTDVDAELLRRARRARFRESSLRDFPVAWRGTVFEPWQGGFHVRTDFREGIELQLQDLRASGPEGLFDLVLCRNLAFTYFDERVQREVATRLRVRLLPGGLLVVGSHEALPHGTPGFSRLHGTPGIYRRNRAIVAHP
jgi:chemotaxis protein methyltransferase CheR